MKTHCIVKEVEASTALCRVKVTPGKVFLLQTKVGKDKLDWLILCDDAVWSSPAAKSPLDAKLMALTNNCVDLKTKDPKDTIVAATLIAAKAAKCEVELSLDATEIVSAKIF